MMINTIFGYRLRPQNISRLKNITNKCATTIGFDSLEITPTTFKR